MTQQPQSRILLIVGLVALLAAVGYYTLNAPDNRSAGDKIGDAVDQLENRTPGEKLGDAVKDVGDDIKKSTKQQ